MLAGRCCEYEEIRGLGAPQGLPWQIGRAVRRPDGKRPLPLPYRARPKKCGVVLTCPNRRSPPLDKSNPKQADCSQPEHRCPHEQAMGQEIQSRKQKHDSDEYGISEECAPCKRESNDSLSFDVLINAKREFPTERCRHAC